MAFTYFFRDLHTLELMVQHTLDAFSGCRQLRVWDAGCAMGPEPYSLAIVFAEQMGHFAYKNLYIDASDLDGSNLFGPIIRDGIYPREQLCRIPVPIFDKYFAPTQPRDHFQLAEGVRKRVQFRRHDLLSLNPFGTGYHLILCKNVLLHFAPSERIEVIRMFADALVPGGHFGTEQTQKLPAELSSRFEQVTPDAQLFRKR